jgi:hypothetical protein
MSGDLLASFRKKPLVMPTLPENDADDYLAFAAKERVERLKIRTAKNQVRAPSYNHLLDVVFDGALGTNFILVFSLYSVQVSGRNLSPVIMALVAGTADYIQEYDAQRWPQKLDVAAPCIESIEFVAPPANES